MILYHSTDDNGVAGIRENGFGVSHLKDSPEQSWLADTREECMTLAHGKEWLVVVELPDDIANRHLYKFEDGTT